eukprot:2497250-Pleurochrysis_carterae.AAC.1
MALVAAVATFHAFFRRFPRVVLESDSLSATFHLAVGRAKDEAAQRVIEYLHAMPAFLAVKPRLHARHAFGAANLMADACSRDRFQKLYLLCARLGVHPKCLQALPDVAAFLGELVPEHGAFKLDLLLLAGDVEVHPGPSGGLAVIANALRDAHPLDPSPLPNISAPVCAVAHDLFLLAPAPQPPASAQPDAALHVPAPRPSPSGFAHGIKPTRAPPSHARDHLPWFVEHNLIADAAQIHEQLDGCLALLQALGDNPGMHGQEGRGGVAQVLGTAH